MDGSPTRLAAQDRETAPGPRVQASAVTWEAPRGGFALDPVTVEIGSGRLIAIIGPSGAGKTTLLELLAGVRVPTGGVVRHPAEIGFVPQDDIVHLQLPLRRTLSYAARLRTRNPPDTVDEVLAVVGLAHRGDARVVTLSGGERKRASVAVELLGQPEVLFLDEPTSGLDPATGRDLLGHLRDLAGAGGDGRVQHAQPRRHGPVRRGDCPCAGRAAGVRRHPGRRACALCRHERRRDL